MLSLTHLLFLITLTIFNSVAHAELSTNQRNDHIVVTGDHFRIVVDADRGGEIVEINLFDGSAWNCVLGGDGQTCPAVGIASNGTEYLLSRAPAANVEQYEATPALVRFRTSAKPRTKAGRPGPWVVKLTYEIYSEGAVFIDLDYELTEGEVKLNASSLSLLVDRVVTSSAKYRSEDTTLKVPPDGKRYDRPGFPSARFAFGKNPMRSYTNEVEALVEYRKPMGAGTKYREESGLFSWNLAERPTKLKAPYHYHNRFAIGLGAAAVGKPKTNIIGQRIYHWLSRRKAEESPGPDWYPSDELIGKMADNHATMLILHQDWMLRGGSCGDPHANYTKAGDHKEMVRAIASAHARGMRVGLYMRGSEPYGLDASFFEKYCKRDWDGIYVDWHGAPSIAAHESRSKPDKEFEKKHHSEDGTYQAAREYFLFMKRLRQIVGPKGFLIGHQGPWNSGVLANLGFDAYLPGEHAGDLNMFADLDTTVYKGMMGGGACVLWPQSPPLFSREAVAKMAVVGLYPHVLLAYVVGPPLAMREIHFESDPDAPVNSYALPYWRLLDAINIEQVTVFNLPSQNLIAATCDAADFHCLVYKESSDSYLIIIGNLGPRVVSTKVTLVPEVLGMEGEYQLSQIDPQTGDIVPHGTASTSFTSTVLSQWDIEGFKLQRKASTTPTVSKEMTSEKIKKLRKEAAGSKRRIVFHSDGMAMDPKKRFLEPGDCVLPYLPGTRTDACTYSLIHQFPVVRLYRSEVGQEWPPGIIEKLYGDGPDGLEEYIDFCHKNGYEAFWAMRTNDTHDAGSDLHGHRRWKSNKWKQDHQELMVGSKDHKPPYAQWTAFDYARPEVREQVFRILEEICLEYDVDGLMLDFFRHLPTFKSTAWGGEASEEERTMLTSMFRRTRKMMDEIGVRRDRPILLAVRTPDSPGYCKALGLDIECWMKDDLVDIWIASGYFRLQEWEETVKIGHKYGVQVWASIDESRVQGRENRNSLEAYRARIMNAWRAGVDAVWLFNFFYYPKDSQFQLLHEAGDIKTLSCTDKLYVAEARRRGHAGGYLKGGDRFFTRPASFSPLAPAVLKDEKPEVINLRVGDDLVAAAADGFLPVATLAIQASPGSGRDDLRVSLNGTPLAYTTPLRDPAYGKGWVTLSVPPSLVKQGINRIEIARGSGSRAEPVLRDLQLFIKYKNKE